MSESEQAQPSDQAKERFPPETQTPEQKQPPRFLCNACASRVTEAHKGDDGTQFYSCPKCGCVNHKKVRQAEEAEQAASASESESPVGDGTSPKVLNHINDVENPELAGKPVTVEAIITTASVSHLVPSKVKISLRTDSVDDDEYDVQRIIDSKDPVNLGLVAITEEAKFARLKRRFSSKDARATINEVTKYRTLYLVRVRPPVSSLEKQGDKVVDDKGYEYKPLDIYVASDVALNFQPSTLIRATGLPLPSPKTQKTTLLAYAVEFPEDNFHYDVQALSALKAAFQGKTVQQRWDWVLDNFERYSHIVRRRNLSKATLLVYFTPLRFTFCGEPVYRGWGIGALVGDSTTAKSETLRKWAKLLKAGTVITAETASIPGLIGTAVNLEGQGWTTDWGLLALMDRKLLGTDGAHKLDGSCWAKLAESERNGEIIIAKAARNTANARTRQVRIYNAIDLDSDKYSTKSLSSFLHPIQALATILDRTSIARLDVAALSDQRDVKPEEINTKATGEPDPAFANLSEALKWTWSSKAKVEWTEDAEQTLLDKATKMYHDFFYEAIPLVSIDVKYKIARLSIALANLTLSTNDDFTVVQVTREHVDAVVDFLTTEYRDAGLGILAKTQQYEKLTQDDICAMFARINGSLSKNPIDNLGEILSFVAKQDRTTTNILKSQFSLAENNQVRPLVAVLQAEGLLKSGKGFYSTPKLIDAFRVTEGFTQPANLIGVIVVNRVKTDTPTPHKPLKQSNDNTSTIAIATTQQPLYLKENALGVGVVNSEGDKSDKYDKNGEAVERAEPQQHGVRALYAKQIRPTAGILCTGEAHENACIKEAEWNLNGNLYCPEHFLASKKTCEDNGYAVREAS